MKISEEQYKDYGQILEQFLEYMFAEDNKGMFSLFRETAKIPNSIGMGI